MDSFIVGLGTVQTLKANYYCNAGGINHYKYKYKFIDLPIKGPQEAYTYTI